ncbi:MAG: PAS domain S-box protein, partial [Ignavibacteriae bacterium]|nr:PAS domain S-box protein [Ignavibacteriota bacterium]
MKKDNKSEAAANLRKKAEELLKKKPVKSVSKLSETETKKPSKAGAQISKADTQRLIHELEVYKVELELENEELRLAKEQAETSSKKYAELFDFAPTGYFSLSKEGEIIQLNLSGAKMLGKERLHLINSRFGFFVSEDTLPVFDDFLEIVFENRIKESCEVAISTDGNLPIHVHLTGIATENEKQCLVAANDVTEQKRAEEELKERVKELTCLYAINGLIEKEDNIEKILQGTADLIPNYWLHSEIACARIVFEGLQYQTGNFRETDWMLSAGLKSYGKLVGVIDLCYLEERPIKDEGPFLKEERNLINAIAEKLKRVTERKKTEETLQLQSAIVENMLEGAILIRPADGLIVYANPAMERISGFTNKEFVGMPISAINAPTGESPEAISRKIIQSLNTTKIWRGEVLNLRKDGTTYWCYANIKAFKHTKYGNVWLSIHQDITDRKKAEAVIKLKNEELQRTNAEKDKFFSIIAHDLRSPFNGFLGLTEILVERLQSMTLDEIHNILVNLKNSAYNLYSLLGNLLEWSLMQRGLTAFEPQLFLLMPKITEIMALVTEAADKKEIAISYDIPEDLSVFADRNMFEGVIRNLSSNAVKFTNKGGVVNISAKSMPDNSVEISVKDTGIGMNKEMTDNLFRLDENSSRKGTEDESSTGLGLIICKDFIEKHG